MPAAFSEQASDVAPQQAEHGGNGDYHPQRIGGEPSEERLGKRLRQRGLEPCCGQQASGGRCEDTADQQEGDEIPLPGEVRHPTETPAQRQHRDQDLEHVDRGEHDGGSDAIAIERIDRCIDSKAAEQVGGPVSARDAEHDGSDEAVGQPNGRYSVGLSGERDPYPGRDGNTEQQDGNGESVAALGPLHGLTPGGRTASAGGDVRCEGIAS